MSNRTNKCYKPYYINDDCKVKSQSKYMLIENNNKNKKCPSSKNYHCHYKATGELVCKPNIIDIHDYMRKKNAIDANKQYKEVSQGGIQKAQCLYDAFGNLVCDINSNY